jgi:hypothetical protein
MQSILKRARREEPKFIDKLDKGSRIAISPSDRKEGNIITYDANGSPNTSGCAASGCQDRPCADYGIMTVADANPANFQYAQQVVTDAVFESLTPL